MSSCMHARISNREQLYANVIETYGAQHQLRMCAEEAAEFIVACLHLQRFESEKNKCDAIDNLITEIADVHICTDQMIQLFNLRKFVDCQSVLAINGFASGMLNTKLNVCATYGSRIITSCLQLAEADDLKIQDQALQAFALYIFGIKYCATQLTEIYNIADKVESETSRKLERLNRLVNDRRLQLACTDLQTQ